MSSTTGAGTASTAGGVILAGGLARRMEGRDKGLIELAGKPMVQWVLEAVSPQLANVLINANRNQSAYSTFGAPVVSDVVSGHLGPLAGLLTGMSTLKNDTVFMCPCDSPFVPDNMVERLHTALMQHPDDMTANETANETAKETADIAIAHDGQRMQPVFCLARRTLKSSLARFLNSGERKIDRWFAQENTVIVDFSDAPNAFNNINSEQERLNVELTLTSL